MQVYKHRKTTAIVIDTVAKRRRDLLALLVITKFSMTVFHFSLRFSPLGVQVVIRGSGDIIYKAFLSECRIQ